MPQQPPHPAKSVIVGRGETITEAADAIGVNPHTFGRVLNKKAATWPAFRRKLSEHLGLPESDLFDTEDDDIARRVAEERAAQGLGPTVTDPATLARVARLLAGAEPSRKAS